MKKVLGYLFYVLAAFLIIGVIGQLSTLISSVIQVLALFTNEFDGYKFGYAFGHCVAWTIYFYIIITLLKYAKKWTRKPIDNAS